MGLIIKLALLVLIIQYAAAKGVSSNITQLCSNGCDWTTAAIWDDGVVPTSADTVDIQVKGTYTIRVSTAVTISDFDIGSNSDPSGTQTLEVVSGGSFSSTGGFDAALSTKIIVDAGGYLEVPTAQATVRGALTVFGSAFFGGSNPSLNVDTYNTQISVNIVYAKLEIRDGGVVRVTNAVTISTTAKLTGDGHINGTLDGRGNIEPGWGGVGVINVWGDFICSTGTDITIEVGSASSFDRMWIGQTFHQDGSLKVTTLGDYEPLSHSLYVVFNTSAQRGGFDSVEGTSLKSFFNDKWTAVVDQSYTAILYDSAPSLLISFVTIAAGLFVTLLL